MSFLRQRWEKNWPEIQAAIGGGLPPFVFSPRPLPLGDEVPVFWYHSVDRDSFAADLSFLRDNGYATLHADELRAHLLRRAPAPANSVVLSFDDGAANLVRVVFPLLAEFGQRAVAFVAPHFHQGATDENDHDRRLCTWSEIRGMAGSGLIDFQSHTLEHRYLPRWPEPAPLAGVDPRFQRLGARPTPLDVDLRASREILEDAVGRPVRHLAFPRFDGTPDAVRIGRDAGYHGFWWGAQPGRPWNRPGDDGTHIVRLSGEFVRRLPGSGRVPLRHILARRYTGAMRGWFR